MITHTKVCCCKWERSQQSQKDEWLKVCTGSFQGFSFTGLLQQQIGGGGRQWQRRLALGKQLLTSYFPHPALITVIISTVSQGSSAPLNPAVPPFCGLEDCADKRIQHSHEVDGDEGGRQWGEGGFQIKSRSRKKKPVLCWCSST